MGRRVLFINLTARMSGAEFSLLGLMAGLDRRGVRPVLLLPEPGALRDAAAAQGIETILLPSLIRFGEYFHFWKLPKMFRAIRELRAIIRSRGISLVHSNTPRAAYIGGPAARLCRVPHITHVRDIGMSPFASRWKSRLIGFFSAAIVCVSHSARDFVTRRTPALAGRSMVIHNGIDLAALDRVGPAPVRRELGIPDAAPLIGACGRIDASKGLDTLVDAAATFAKAFPQARVLIIGEVFESRHKPFLESLQAKIAARGLGERFFITGHRPDALAAMKGLDVVVHPALCPDSLPRTVLEAAGLRKPVVASRIGGIPEILEDSVSGVLFTPGDAAALAQAVIALLRDPGKAAMMGAAARERIAALFTIERHLAAVTALYGSLWNEGTASPEAAVTGKVEDADG